MNGKKLVCVSGALLLGLAFSLSPVSAEAEEYTENEWGFVDVSLDASEGIPAVALGRFELIREKGILTVATDPHYAPQEFIDPAKGNEELIVGADLELAQRIADRMGVELHVLPFEFADVLKVVENGRCDLAISGLAYTPGRASSMTLSKGYHFPESNEGTGILIREEDSGRIRSLEDLASRDLVAQSGSLQEMLLADHVSNYRQFRRPDSMIEVYEEVAEGRADAAAVDIESAKVYLESNPYCGLMLLDSVHLQLEEQYRGDRVAAPPGEEQLISFVNGVIDEVLESGEYSEWFQSYSDYAAEMGL